VEDCQAVLSRFNRLMRDIENGEITRTCFRAWEVELLLDIQACDLPPADRRRILQRYRKAVQRRLEQGLGRPLKLSEYLARLRSRAAAMTGAF
jgi:hypothetical protein